MASQQHLDKMQARQNYRNLWHTDLMGTIQADTPLQIAASLSGVDHVFHTCSVKELFTMTCQGTHVVLVICHAVESVEKANVLNFALLLRSSVKDLISKADILVALERMDCSTVFCCFGNSVASTRFLLQDEFNIQTSQCDNCIIVLSLSLHGFMFCLQQLACIFSIVAMIVGSEELSEASQLLSCLSDMVYCTVCACMQTQHKIEMDKRDGMFGPQVMAVPPMQQMSRIDQPIPPSVGYPSQPAYAPQPYGYPPPQQAQGYPPAGYPPPGYPPSGYSK
ncbi:hypothetical protein RJ641_035567 [Dillenia turbinata]|uniref:Uncharacterized protein n=1 Tax=Dillenia turbinata TaxID=194707 RepID=A0AAN8VXT3_9MAGN